MTTVTLDSPAVSSASGYRFIPAPQAAPSFGGLMNLLGGIAGDIAQTAAGGISGDYQSLITMQLEAQRQMMLVSMVSNVEKSKHETQMAPVRNIRVG